MHITFVTAGLTFHGDSLKEQSLGGSETAVISMAAALRARGHRVRVFCNCDKPGVYDGVFYHARREFEVQAELVPTDVLIASRWTDALMCQSAAGLRVLWLHDVADGNPEFIKTLYQTDAIFGLSDYHIENHCQKVPEMRPLFWKTANGVDKGLIQDSVRTKVPGKLIYTSRPERGLLNLLRMMPKIWDTHPKAKLHVATYSLQNLPVDDRVKMLHETCESMMQKMGSRVVRLGELTKAMLYEQISSAELMVYPTSFPEISCISAMEAQACGTPIITTNAFALKESVQPFGGVLIAGLPEGPSSAAYEKIFVETVNRLLFESPELLEMSESCRTQYFNGTRSWESIAASWEAKFDRDFAARDRSKVLKTLRRNGDKQAVLLITGKEYVQDDQIIDLSQVSMLFRNAREKWNALLKVIVRCKGKLPESILDFGADDVSFGLYAAKAIPSCTVVIAARPGCKERLEEYVAQSGLTNAVVEDSECPDFRVTSADQNHFNYGRFDLVFVGTMLEEQENPQSLVQYLNPLVSKKGSLSGTTRWNTDGLGGRRWNLDYEDLRVMFEDSDLEASFHSGVRTPDGRVQGHWLWIAKPSLPKKFDLKGKLRRTRPYQSLAVCMIAKNEQDFISGSLKSVLPIADKVVVVDTGSKDDTAGIASSLGAEVRHVKFDNFSQARNESIAGVQEDWILWIDADERVTSAELVRKYLETSIFNGFAIRQNHLVLDVDKFFDIPVRLLRNRPEYKFTGLIHEHCEDISSQPYDKQIEPTFLVPDVDIVHYGYVSERVRRAKCSRRNFELLIRDITESPGRMLTWTLVMRDYINMVKWATERTRGRIDEGSVEHDLLNSVVATFHNKFGDGSSRYYGIAVGMYQEALRAMGMSGLCAMHFDHPPFEVALTLVGAIGGVTNKDIPTRNKWFICVEEFQSFMHGKTDDLSAVIAGEQAPPAEPFRMICELPDPISRLRAGVNAVPDMLM